MATLYTQQDSNIRKTWLLMTVFLVLIIAFGFLFSQIYGSPEILYIAVILSIGMNVVAYWKSDTIALAMSHAKPIKREGNEYIYRMIENLSITAGLPMPRVYIIESDQINAFATGRDPKHSAIAVTQGALTKLENEELEGVLAHELSHIGNRDILISTVVVVLSGLIAIMADWFLRISFWGGRSSDDNKSGGAILLVVGLIAAILAPLAATIIQLAVSRKREFLADASGALLTRYPDGLANALEKIGKEEIPLKFAHNATAHLFISNPFKGKEGTSWFTRLFLTHPPIQERIKILRNMSV
ncbi:MAG: zinc metalloprotease HtpX [Candidatus Yanofskybacteria bacterium RIFCSPHIGHO2_01_FULL_41_21]|uniref:Protease HtpX homolog n=1 Tax=Candidatus Yanofskybacteria bacterium RIFCSPHIGHO2_01_FULL_41_21 TaxID=1802660 RepID=A0A1F8EAC5_9BACT|nr:MAG: zinc metalloprotease HtpX [Candidatus Yanofskybacteria bacterium RIFCSPHIGHO2_01_FULL_41_21]